MDPVPEAKRREVKTFLSFVSGADSERAVDARTFHITATYDTGDFAALSEGLLDAGATGSFSMLARDLDVQAEAVETLADDGHEITLHGYRHTSFGDAPYETAHEELSAALDAFDDATGVRPTGFHVAFMDVSEGTLRAAAELDIEWLLGRPEDTVPDGLTTVQPVSPWDTRLLEGGESSEATFERLGDDAEDGAVFLCHPNLHEYYGASDAFDGWVADHRPAAVAEMLADGGVGMVVDCVKPIRVD